MTIAQERAIKEKRRASGFVSVGLVVEQADGSVEWSYRTKDRSTHLVRISSNGAIVRHAIVDLR